jgi:hypothetical protein
VPIGAANYRQVATYWGSPIPDEFGGAHFSSPKRVRCRWEERVEIFMGDDGEEHASRAIVWTYEKLEIGGYLALGEYLNVLSPLDLDAALRIARSDEIPDLRGLHYERKSYL